MRRALPSGPSVSHTVDEKAAITEEASTLLLLSRSSTWRRLRVCCHGRDGATKYQTVNRFLRRGDFCPLIYRWNSARTRRNAITEMKKSEKTRRVFLFLDFLRLTILMALISAVYAPPPDMAYKPRHSTFLTYKPSFEQAPP